MDFFKKMTTSENKPKKVSVKNQKDSQNIHDQLNKAIGVLTNDKTSMSIEKRTKKIIKMVDDEKFKKDVISKLNDLILKQFSEPSLKKSQIESQRKILVLSVISEHLKKNKKVYTSKKIMKSNQI